MRKMSSCSMMHEIRKCETRNVCVRSWNPSHTRRLLWKETRTQTTGDPKKDLQEDKRMSVGTPT